MLRWSASSYARRATSFLTTSASLNRLSSFIANRDTAAAVGSVIANVPSRTRSSGLRNFRWSSVNASGPSTTALASIASSTRPVPSEAVSDHGAIGSRGGAVRRTLIATGASGGTSSSTGDGGDVERHHNANASTKLVTK